MPWPMLLKVVFIRPGSETNGRGKGFEDSDPTHTAATRRPNAAPRLGQARRHADLGARPGARRGGWTLHRGLLLIRSSSAGMGVPEKRGAATQPVARSRADLDREIQAENHAIRSIESR